MKSTVQWLLLIATLLGGPVMAASWATESFRTQTGGLVQVDDTMVEVLQNAGEPAARQIISHGITLGGAVGFNHEQWTYRESDGTYTVTFAGNVVIGIVVVPHR